jgi:hypothetical protein
MLIERIGVASHSHVPPAVRGSTFREHTGEGIREAFRDRHRNTGVGD